MAARMSARPTTLQSTIEKILETPNDLINLSECNEEIIANVLQNRHREGLYYTNLGSRVLLSVNPLTNPNTDSNKEIEESIKEYTTDYKNFTGDRRDLNPHVFKLATTCYLHLKRSGLDQSVIFYGDSGAGKSENKKLFIKQLAGLRASSKKETRLYNQILNVEYLFDSFGKASTPNNSLASRFGKYIEIQFDNKSRTVGVKHLDYLLEKSRITTTPRGESNFYVFYQLLYGLTPDEKSQFRLQEPSFYHYLQGTNIPKSSFELREEFLNLKVIMKSLGFTKKSSSQIFQLLAAILHLGNIRFVDSNNQNNSEAALIRNREVLELVSDLLGLHYEALEGLLTYKTNIIKKEACTIFLDADQSADRRDELARCLFSLLFSWITEFLNSRLCCDFQTNFIGLLDLPGFHNSLEINNFGHFCVNFANERVSNYMRFHVFESCNDAYFEDNLKVPTFDYPGNHDLVQLFIKPNVGLIPTLSKQANRSRGPASDSALLQAFQKAQGTTENFSVNNSMNQFTIRHSFETVVYDAVGFMEADVDSISPDFIQAFRGGENEIVGNAFVAGLFNNSSIATENHPKDSSAIISAQQSTLPQRQPSMKRTRVKSSDNPDDDNATSGKGKINCYTSQLEAGLNELFDTFDNTEAWFVLNISPGRLQLDPSILQAQVSRYGLSDMVKRKRIEYTVCYTHEEFVIRYESVLKPLEIDPNRTSRQVCEQARTIFGWGEEKMNLGNQYIYLQEQIWRDLEDHLRAAEHGMKTGEVGLPYPTILGNEDAQSFYSDDDANSEDHNQDSASQDGDMNLEREANQLQLVTEDESEDTKPPKTAIRRAWICCTWALTWWIPSYFLHCCGRMKLKDIRMAWREKVSLCILILLLSALTVLFIVGINPLVCPERNIYSTEEISAYKTKEKPLYHMYGRVYDMRRIGGFNDRHYQVNQERMLENFAGQDLSKNFPIQINPSLCLTFDGNEINPQVSLSNVTSNALMINHDRRWYRGANNYDPHWWENVIRYRMKKVGEVAYTMKQIKDNAFSRDWFVYFDKSGKTPIHRVYDFTSYTKDLYALPRPKEQKATSADQYFLGPDMPGFIQKVKGMDATNAFDKEFYPDNPEYRDNILQCMNNLFYAGVVDDRNSPQCIFAQYLLLALSIFLFAILFVKFLASLQLGSRPEPEDHDKFVICNVPCYTEDDESLRRTIDSLAVLKYDDKRKLLFVISDGMVVGGGNDLPTPRIVLNLLKADPNLDPEPLSFISIGEGAKQHNMGKVYTGLYEIRGHIVPYIVVVKVGKVGERAKPGNRGKRDSQLILMKFFNKVHYDHPMVPLELEIYHQIKNIIGVDPHLYDYVLMVDADTVVMPDSLNRLVSVMINDAKIMGVCGETALMNEKDSWATMIQVYEYFISHHLSKAFESLFGSVTCLPGCFSMYRLRSPINDTPLLIHNRVIEEYSENRVDTLHKKNLLHLGEDRYLTTLLLKNFPFQKMTFTPDAKCITNAPDTWDVLLSQRRRWINSTIHNLLELVFLPQLCGFCCFSMRFVVFMDLLSTVIMPATLGYLGYLLYRLITDRTNTIPLASLLFIAAPYAMQVMVFLLHRQWQHIGWMIIYLLALPIFAFFIPIYSFWHFDDFSWGNTRVVMGEGGKKKKVAADEGKFDPKSIPLRKWADYEEELIEKHLEKKTQYSKSDTNSEYMPPVRNASPLSFAPPPVDINQFYSSQIPPIHNTGYGYGSQVPINYGFRAPSPSPSQMSAMPLATNNNHYNNPPRSNYGSALPSPARIPQGSDAFHLDYSSKPNSRTGSPNMSQVTLNNLTPGQIPVLPTHQPGSDWPGDSEVVHEIRGILAHADLMALSKKQVRTQLNQAFNFDFDPHKKQINLWIERILQGQL